MLNRVVVWFVLWIKITKPKVLSLKKTSTMSMWINVPLI